MNPGTQQREALRLIGVSVAHMPGSVVEQLLGMRERISRFNERHGLRTALLYTGGWFVQWHEGPPEAVECTWQISLSHGGHSHARIVHRSEGGMSLPQPLQIATLHSRDKPTDVARRLFDIERERALGIALAPATIWARLSGPVVEGRFSGPLDEARRIIALTSEFNESVDLIKAIAEKFRVPVNYQRFADGDLRNSDVGAAYIDLDCAGRTRVQALSRHVLANAIVRLSLGTPDCVVMLVGDRPRVAGVLATAVARYICGWPRPPSVRLMSASTEACHTAADLLQAYCSDIDQVVAGPPGRSPLAAVLALIEQVHACC